jgi:hypothetical protein
MYQNQPDPKWLQLKSSKGLQIKEAAKAIEVKIVKSCLL